MMKLFTTPKADAFFELEGHRSIRDELMMSGAKEHATSIAVPSPTVPSTPQLLGKRKSHLPYLGSRKTLANTAVVTPQVNVTQRPRNLDDKVAAYQYASQSFRRKYHTKLSSVISELYRSPTHQKLFEPMLSPPSRVRPDDVGEGPTRGSRLERLVLLSKFSSAQQKFLRNNCAINDVLGPQCEIKKCRKKLMRHMETVLPLNTGMTETLQNSLDIGQEKIILNADKFLGGEDNSDLGSFKPVLGPEAPKPTARTKSKRKQAAKKRKVTRHAVRLDYSNYVRVSALKSILLSLLEKAIQDPEFLKLLSKDPAIPSVMELALSHDDTKYFGEQLRVTSIR